jgi:hypothetical protein
MRRQRVALRKATTKRPVGKKETRKIIVKKEAIETYAKGFSCR